MYKELVSKDRANLQAFRQCLSHITPFDIEDYLVLRRESKNIEGSAAALGWSQDQLRGSQRYLTKFKAQKPPKGSTSGALAATKTL